MSPCGGANGGGREDETRERGGAAPASAARARPHRVDPDLLAHLAADVAQPLGAVDALRLEPAVAWGGRGGGLGARRRTSRAALRVCVCGGCAAVGGRGARRGAPSMRSTCAYSERREGEREVRRRGGRATRASRQPRARARPQTLGARGNGPDGRRGGRAAAAGRPAATARLPPRSPVGLSAARALAVLFKHQLPLLVVLVLAAPPVLAALALVLGLHGAAGGGSAGGRTRPASAPSLSRRRGARRRRRDGRAARGAEARESGGSRAGGASPAGRRRAWAAAAPNPPRGAARTIFAPRARGCRARPLPGGVHAAEAVCERVPRNSAGSAAQAHTHLRLARHSSAVTRACKSRRKGGATCSEATSRNLRTSGPRGPPHPRGPCCPAGALRGDGTGRSAVLGRARRG